MKHNMHDSGSDLSCKSVKKLTFVILFFNQQIVLSYDLSLGLQWLLVPQTGATFCDFRTRMGLFFSLTSKKNQNRCTVSAWEAGLKDILPSELK
jgi:hypothetical protein